MKRQALSIQKWFYKSISRESRVYQFLAMNWMSRKYLVIIATTSDPRSRIHRRHGILTKQLPLLGLYLSLLRPESSFSFRRTEPFMPRNEVENYKAVTVPQLFHPDLSSLTHSGSFPCSRRRFLGKVRRMNTRLLSDLVRRPQNLNPHVGFLRTG